MELLTMNRAAGQSEPVEPLREIAAKKGRIYGGAALQSVLSKDTEYARIFARQCGILVPEGELKWGSLRPSPTTYNFAPADWLLSYTKANRMLMRGHTLVWYQSLPKWFDGYVNQGNAKQMLQDHIATVVGHFSGNMHSWDVVNEILYPEDKIQGGWRNTPWLKLLGPGHIEMAFRLAAQADPHALLVWNENHIEDESYGHENKRRIWLMQLQALLAKKVPIGGIGIQSHLVGGQGQVGGPKFRQFLTDVSNLGLKILITELDVQDTGFVADPKQRDVQVADVYDRYLNAVLQNRSTIAVLTWGLSDQYSWLNTFVPRSDGLLARPLPFDASFQPTLAYYATRRAFQSANPI